MHSPRIPGDIGRLHCGTASVRGACDRSESVLSRSSGDHRRLYSEPMKPFHVLAFAGLLSTASAAEIPAGTHLLLRMENSVSSRTAKAGDGVYFRTVTPLSAGGRIMV